MFAPSLQWAIRPIRRWPKVWIWLVLSASAGLFIAAGVFRHQASVAREGVPDIPAAEQRPASPPARATLPPPAEPQTQRLISVAQAAASRAAVKLIAITLAPPADVAVELRGTYPAVKQWLAELTDRFESLVVTRIDLRAADGVPGTPMEAATMTQGEIRMRLLEPPSLSARPGADAPGGGAPR